LIPRTTGNKKNHERFRLQKSKRQPFIAGVVVCVGGGRDVDWMRVASTGQLKYLVLVWNLFLGVDACCWRWESAGNTGRARGAGGNCIRWRRCGCCSSERAVYIHGPDSLTAGSAGITGGPDALNPAGGHDRIFAGVSVIDI